MNFNFKSFLKMMCLMATVSFSQMVYGQYVSPDIAVTKLQVEVVKFQALVNTPPSGSGVLTTASAHTPPSMYVMIMEDMIVKISESKKVEPAIAAWEQILNQQTGSRRVNLKKVIDHVKVVLKD